MLINMMQSIGYLILIYFIILSGCYVFLLALSIKDIYLSFASFDLSEKINIFFRLKMPPVTVIIPSFNEENNIMNAVYSVFESIDYENIFVIVVNDGSTDNTLENLIKHFDLYETHEGLNESIKIYGQVKGYYRSRTDLKILVIDKENGEKSDALNAGLNACRTPLFITMDADTMIENNAISALVWEMIKKKNAVSVGGAVYILNGCTYHDGIIEQFKMSKNPLCAIQACEYIRSFLFSRSGWNALGGTLCYSGAFTLFDHKMVSAIGGFDQKNPAQDFEIITHIQKYIKDNNTKENVSYTPSATAWTLVPENFKEFWHQRINWQMGSIRSLMLHKEMLFNTKYGVVGLFTYPFFLFGEIGSAIVEFTAYIFTITSWMLGILDPVLTTMIFLLCWGFSAFLTFSTLLMSAITFNKYRYLSDLFWIFLVTIIDMCGFRQFNAFCRTYATFKYFLSKPYPSASA
jgi:cellulose synthase/poly-beta-1,6-N-acetylglucosamine synthase-like glycosyltransferase